MTGQASQASAARAGILWQDYEEQSTYLYYHLGRQRQLATTFTHVTSSEGQTFGLEHPQDRVEAE